MELNELSRRALRKYFEEIIPALKFPRVTKLINHDGIKFLSTSQTLWYRLVG